MNAAPAPAMSWRTRMAGVHTWCGIVLGVLLLVVFWMGTLSVFDRELDRWMMPATRLPAPSHPPRLDALQPVVQALVPAGARQWRIDWATPRTPVLRLSWQGPDGARGQRYLDAATLAVLYSDLKKAGKGDVIYTRRKWVRKAKGAKPGSVIVTQEKTLFVRLDKSRLDALKQRSR